MSAVPKQTLIKPVVRTLYRQLFRLGDEYGKLASLSNLTVKQEIDRFTASANSSSRKAARRAASNRVDDDHGNGMTGVIPVAPGLMIAIRSRSSDDSASHSTSLNRFDSTKVVSELDSFAEILSATSAEGSEVLTPSIVRQIVSQLFRHPKTSHDVNEQQLIGVGFLALRTLKERIQSIRNNLVPPSSGFVTRAGDLTLDSSVAPEPTLTDLTNEATTESEGIRVVIKTKYTRAPEIPSSQSASSPLFAGTAPASSYNFSYECTITNVHPSRTVQLLSRAWAFTDVKGVCQRIRGAGVVGQTPVLVPGQTFKYDSFVNLAEPRGCMEGTLTFHLIEDPQKSSPLKSGEKFDVPVGPVLLAAAQKSTPSQATET